MELDFSVLQPIMNDMVLKLLILLIGMSVVLTVLMGLMKKLRFPNFITDSITAIAAIGCIYYWVQYFL